MGLPYQIAGTLGIEMHQCAFFSHRDKSKKQSIPSSREYIVYMCVCDFLVCFWQFLALMEKKFKKFLV